MVNHKKLEATLLAIYEDVEEKSTAQFLILPPVMSYEGGKKTWFLWNEFTYTSLVKSLIAYINRFKRTNIALYDWVELREEAERLISHTYIPYYIGHEEGLEDLSCWKDPEEKGAEHTYLFFDSTRGWYTKGYQGEFSNHLFKQYSEDELRKNIITVEDGKVFFKNSSEPLDGNGKYVVKENGCVYWKSSAMGRFNHTSLTKGRRVLAAGWMKFKDNSLACINANTGHYKTSSKQFQYLLDYFKKRGLEAKKC